jgi:hypothetical protein
MQHDQERRDDHRRLEDPEGKGAGKRTETTGYPAHSREPIFWMTSKFGPSINSARTIKRRRAENLG